ncbi:hypothetical protein ACPF4D_001589 [Vibrio cholerae]|uniref:hypothetical protein n=1 Tax=Vibrio cholerae TaxID=666 RepID=UPI000E0AE61A|nr:hypothetical protein [Vibrio cholerae]BER94721.1 hypothetical protein VNVC001_10420 [Vibrio cholerae]
MTAAELQDLIICINIEVGDDVKSGNTSKTKYKLPKEALTDEVIKSLKNNFSDFKSVTVNNDFLILEHPDRD